MAGVYRNWCSLWLVFSVTGVLSGWCFEWLVFAVTGDW